MQQVIITHKIADELTKALVSGNYDKVFTFTDKNTRLHCLPIINSCEATRNAYHITIDASDTNKTLESAVHVWRELSDNGCTRHSCMVNVGGGMVTDLGGFAASCFKRGIDFINVPTTLLAMVDASVGGKTGVNFNGLKNEIGVFKDANTVFIDTIFLKTLDHQNILSGYAEMLKHSLISDDKIWARHLLFDFDKLDLNELSLMIADSIELKRRIVTEDPHENGIRKALNLGHTIGHALESLAMQKGKPLLHGYAIAYGLVGELFLSCALLNFPTTKMRQTTRFVLDNYGRPEFSCKDYDKLFSLMLHDKKNTGDMINFTLLSDVGEVRINQTASKELVFEALDFLRES